MSSASGGGTGGRGNGASGVSGGNGGDVCNDEQGGAGGGAKRTRNARLDPFETSTEEFDREGETSPEIDPRPDTYAVTPDVRALESRPTTPAGPLTVAQLNWQTEVVRRQENAIVWTILQHGHTWTSQDSAWFKTSTTTLGVVWTHIVITDYVYALERRRRSTSLPEVSSVRPILVTAAGSCVDVILGTA